MVFESQPWKRDLRRRKQLFVRYNTIEQFNKNEESTYTVLEKAIFYSAFIIRKLIDSHTKLSDEADNYTLSVSKYRPTKVINSFNRRAEYDSYDWEHPNKEKVLGKDICNWLIHSYIFIFTVNEMGTIAGFYVSSDYDRNKALYYIDIQCWFDYMDFVANDDIALIESHYNEKQNDYLAVRKDRVKQYKKEND